MKGCYERELLQRTRALLALRTGSLQPPGKVQPFCYTVGLLIPSYKVTRHYCCCKCRLGQ